MGHTCKTMEVATFASQRRVFLRSGCVVAHKGVRMIVLPVDDRDAAPSSFVWGDLAARKGDVALRPFVRHVLALARVQRCEWKG
jgi:hypothetical protein